MLGLLWTALARDLQAQIAAETAQSQRGLDNVAEIGLHALELTIHGADLLLLELRHEWQLHRGDFSSLVQLRERQRAIGFAFDITVLDRHGRVVFSTSAAQRMGMDLGQLPLVSRLRDATTDPLSISAVRPAGGHLVMELARRLRTADGGFDGVLICTLPSHFLRSHYAEAKFEPGTTLAAVRRDGRLLVQLTSGPDGTLTEVSPPPAWAWLPAYGASRRETLQRAAPTMDASRQLTSWREGHHYPFMFGVTTPANGLDATLASLRWRYAAAAAAVAAGVLAALGWFFRRDALRERAAREQAAHLKALTQAQAALAASEGELRKLSSHQMAVKEAEHRRLAQEIHDELGQRLTVHRMDLALLPQAVRDDPARELPDRVAAMKSDVDAMLQIARDVAGQLRPAALDVGLGPAVESMLHDVQDKLGVRCELDNRLPPQFTTDDTRATSAFRIVQEAVTNAVRHGNPRRIRVVLDHSADRLLLRIEDDGAGFDQHAQAAGFGVKGMRQRAHALGGDLRVRSAAGQGTTVQAEFPLHGEVDAAVRIGAADAESSKG